MHVVADSGPMEGVSAVMERGLERCKFRFTERRVGILASRRELRGKLLSPAALEAGSSFPRGGLGHAFAPHSSARKNTLSFRTWNG